MKYAGLGTLLCACLAIAPAQAIERELHVSDSPSAVELQELATVLRTVFDFADLSIVTPSSTITVRGTVSQIESAEWLLHDLEAPAELRERAAHEHLLAGDKTPVIRIFYLKASATQQYLQETLSLVRTVADIRQAFVVSRRQAVIIRGTRADTDISAWMIGEIDHSGSQPEGYSGVHQYHAATGDLVRVFYPQDRERPDFAPIMVTLRAQLKTHKLFFVTSPAALAVRGTSNEIASAEKLISVR